MRQTALDSIFEISKNNKKIVFIGSDLGPNVMKDFKKFPHRFLWMA